MEQDAPSTFQQEAIVEKAGELFGWCDATGRQTARSKQDAAALMQSVLAEAFS